MKAEAVPMMDSSFVSAKGSLQPGCFVKISKSLFIIQID